MSALSAFASWLINAFVFLAITIINFLVDVINAAIVVIASIFSALLSVFPTSSLDFTPPPGLIAVASHINWFIPVGSFATAFAIFCASYITFFSIRPVAKFLQLA